MSSSKQEARSNAKEKASAHLSQAERNRRARERLLHDDEARAARIAGITVADGFDISKLDQKQVSQALQGGTWDQNDQDRYDKIMGIEKPKPEEPKPEEPKDPKPEPPIQKDPMPTLPDDDGPGDIPGMPSFPGEGGGLPGWGWGGGARGGDAYNLNNTDNDVYVTGNGNTVDVDNSVFQQSFGGNATSGSFGRPRGDRRYDYGAKYLAKYLGGQ